MKKTPLQKALNNEFSKDDAFFKIFSSKKLLLSNEIGNEASIISKNKNIIPNKIQLIAELFYNFIAKMISDTAGKKAKPFFPFIFSLFVFILF